MWYYRALHRHVARALAQNLGAGGDERSLSFALHGFELRAVPAN